MEWACHRKMSGTGQPDPNYKKSIHIYKEVISVCMSYYNSWTSLPICLKLWLGNSEETQEYVPSLVLSYSLSWLTLIDKV